MAARKDPEVPDETRRRIKTACAWRGISVSKLARMMGYRPDNFFHSLRGRQRYVVPLTEIAAQLEIPVDALMPGGPKAPLTKG